MTSTNDGFLQKMQLALMKVWN